MKLTLLSLLFSCATFLSAQSITLQNLAAQYPDDDLRSELNLSGNWLRMLTKDKDADQPTKGYLDGVHILSVPRESKSSLRMLSGKLEREGYELLTSFRSNGDQGYILIKEGRKGITELIAAFAGEENKLTTISVTGLFTLDDLDNIDVDIDGWDKVRRGR